MREDRVQLAKSRRAALRIVGIYALLGGLWILLSDWLLSLLTPPDLFLRLQTLKGWFYVGLTAILLYGLLWGQLRRLTRSQNALRHMKDAYRLLTACNEILVRARDERTMLEELCHHIWQMGDYQRVWIGLVEGENEVHIEPTAWAGAGAADILAQQVASDAGASLVITALQRKEPTFSPVDDSARTPHSWSVVIPLVVGESLLGVLGIHWQVFRSFAARERRLFSDLGRDLASGLNVLRERAARREAQVALREERDLVARLMETSPVGIFMVQRSGEISFANPRAAEILSLSVERLEQRTFGSLGFRSPVASNSEDLSPDSILRQVVEEGHALSDMRVCLAGRDRRLTISGAPLRSAGEEITGGVFVLQDVTEQFVMAESLRQSEERLHLALDAINDGLWDWNVATGSVYFNDRWATMLGFEPEEIEGTLETWEALLHPEDKARVNAVLQAHLDGKTSYYETEHRLKTKSGDWIWVQDRGRVVARDAEGRPLRAVGTHTDITTRKETEQALAVSQRRFSLFMDFMPAGIFIKDDALHVIYSNRYLKERFQVENWMGKHSADIFPEAIAETMIARDRQALREGYIMYEEVIPDVEGLERIYQTHKFRIEQPDGPHLLGGIALDITRRKEAERDLREYAQRLELLRKIDRAVLAARSPKEIAVAALEQTGVLIGCDHAVVGRLDATVDKVELLALWGTVEDDLLPGATFSLKELGVPASVLERQIHISNNLDESSLAPNKEICDFCAGARACIILPLQARGRLVGLFYLSSRHREWFTEERVEIAGEIADQLAIALDDAELHAQVQRHAAELEERVDARTAELRALVDAMAGREVRMMELKEVIRELRGQLERAGLEPLADDPLLGV